jgi:hypothetical protein
MQNTNITINRIGNYTTLELPHSLAEVSVSPNEWVSHDTINQSFKKLYVNYEYLKDMCFIYDLPPNTISEWYGNDALNITWHDNVNISNATNNNPLTAVNDIAIMSNNFIVLADDTFVKLLSSDADNTFINQTNELGIGTFFKKIKTIELDSNDNIYLLDEENLRIVVLNYDINYIENGKCQPWTTMTSWGGFAGSQAKFGFNKPVDIYIYNNTLYALDKGNGVIKEYTLAGDFIKNISNELFKDGVSLMIDSSEYIFVLRENNIISKFDKEANHIQSITFASEFTNPQKIRPNYSDTRFIYVSTEKKMLKFTNEQLLLAGIFGDDLDDIYKNYHGIFSVNDKLYVANQNNILRYSDTTKFFSYKTDTTDTEWELEALQINKDEFVEAWVYNKIFNRFWDNLEIFRRALYGKPIVKEFLPGVDEVFIRTFTTEELMPFEYQKSDIYIGINEIVSSEVINRCIKQLYSNMLVLMNLLISETKE